MKAGHAIVLAALLIATPAAAQISDENVQLAKDLVRDIYKKKNVEVDAIDVVRLNDTEMKAVTDLTFAGQHLQSICAITLSTADGKLLAECHLP